MGLVFAGTGSQIAGANAAANAQKKATTAAINEQNKMFNTVQQNLEPYNQTGQTAMGTLNNLLSPNSLTAMQTLQSLPGYQFTLNQGLQAVQSGAAARGLGSSGAAMRGAADYATGLANQNYLSYANQLQNLTNTGESAAAGVGQAAMSTGQGISNNLTGMGNAQAAADISTGNAFSNTLNNLLLLTAAGGKGGLYGGA